MVWVLGAPGGLLFINFSVKGQIINILGFADCIRSQLHILFFFFFQQPFKNIKTTLSGHTEETRFGPQSPLSLGYLLERSGSL